MKDLTRSPFELIDHVQDELDELLITAESGAAESLPGTVEQLCRMLQAACRTDTDACLGTIFLKKDARYSVKHPIHIALVCEVVSGYFGWSDDKRASLLSAALTCNIGMSALQEKLYHQKTVLTDEQRQQVHEHPRRSVEILKAAGVTDKLWLDGVLHHHEAIDGSGYPSGLSGDEISPGAKIIAVGDIYSAAVTERFYRSPLSPDEALRVIYISDSRIDSSIIHLCVNLFGVYPPGTVVELASDEIAVVIHRGKKAHCPVVKSIRKKGIGALAVPETRDCSERKFAIRTVLSSDEARIHLHACELWNYNDKIFCE